MARILNDPSLFADWQRDIKVMANRIIDVRKKLRDILTDELKTPGSWDHITSQIGMFRSVLSASGSTSLTQGYSFTGLNSEQSQALVDRAHIYLTNNGRISMAGINSHNLKYVAESIDKVVRGQL
jgi:aspartate aminotransferase